MNGSIGWHASPSSATRPFDQDGGGHVVMGLEFQEITNKDRDMITQYIIKAQMPG